MIKISTTSEKKNNKSERQIKKGLKLIAKSLKGTQKTMKTLLDLFLGEFGETDRSSRNSSFSRTSTKRSNSVFGCFGSICSKSKSIDISKPLKTEETERRDKKSKKERKDKSDSKHKKDKDKSKKKRKDLKDTLEVPKYPETIPVIKGRKNNETFDVSTKEKDLKAINLNSTFQKPDIIRKSRNSLQDIKIQGKTTGDKITLEDENKSEDKGFASQNMINPKEFSYNPEIIAPIPFSRKLKVSPKGSMNSDTRFETIKSLKYTIFKENQNSNNIKKSSKVTLEESNLNSSASKIGKILQEIDKMTESKK